MVLSVIKYCITDDSSKDALQASKEAKKLEKLNRFITLNYEKLIFPLTMFSMFLICFSLAVLLMSNDSRSLAYSTSFNGIYFYFFLQMTFLILYEAIFRLKQQECVGLDKENGYYENYIRIYLFQSVAMVALIACLRNSSFGVSIILGQSIAYFFFLLVYRPYALFFHNICLAYDQIVFIGWISFLVCLQRKQLDEHMTVISAYLLISFTFLIPILSFIRIRYHQKYNKKVVRNIQRIQKQY